MKKAGQHIVRPFHHFDYIKAFCKFDNMTISVSVNNEQEEKVLLAFLNSLEYDYQTDDDYVLTPEQQKEILRRDKEFLNGKTTARDWNEIKDELRNVYR